MLLCSYSTSEIVSVNGLTKNNEIEYAMHYLIVNNYHIFVNNQKIHIN